MNINNQINKVFYSLIFISCSSMSNHFDEDNVCFYSNDGYIEKGGSKKFCVPSYTEDEWLFSQWNNNIASIKIPLNLQVDVFSDFSFTGRSASFYKSTNSAELEKYGLISDISSYRVLPKELYSSNKRIIFTYHSHLFPERYLSYNYYLSRGHSILLSRKDQPIDIDSQSSSVFYSHAGQIMTAFAGQGFDRNLYCLFPADRREGNLAADVTFSYCDIGNKGQVWLPQKIKDQTVLINKATGTALSLDEQGFYVSLHSRSNVMNQLFGRVNQNYHSEIEINENTIWFDESYIESMKSFAVRPFLQYKETFEALNEFGHRDVIVNHLDKSDDINVYLGGDKIGMHVYYNAETKSLISYNKYSDEQKLKEASCLSLINNPVVQGSDLPVNFTYNRSSYSDNAIEYRCDNGISYNKYTHRWNFIADDQYHFLVNGHENKVLHFYINENPQKINFRGGVIGPKVGEHIGQAINFSDRKPQDAIFINNLALAHILEMEKGICELSAAQDKNNTPCGGTNTRWSSTDYQVLNTDLSRDYIPWLLSQIAHRLHMNEWTDELAAFLQKVEALETLFEQKRNQPADKPALEQTKTLLVEFLQTYGSDEYTKIWHQAAYLLNRIDVLIEWENN
ncbi:TPA: hypothetical protein ACY3XX_001550 [Yersinia enterocolitica]|uniref:Acetyltransferase domain-containing protein n=2 Tax=Yersinia enterocolitica TaxID=630 RepID=A0A0H3NUG5_YERE1|nr:hypothetical protein [Yersinia enterocolitica]EHB21690.1 hypothetical protein IOK_06764 [Yersinia enterocolitica subsp. palearctica PhRBD_Ye1]EKN3315267.1 hypothetical protein [Yersinia enterocolitica]EKN3317518.1 hypothetical protein [Yersinia enterocolitica]EKN3321061.1 hypothetical protein [Yersinia enterocolitica]EKN3333200.1 hypothetical protein [Yersinia enterocolitica]